MPGHHFHLAIQFEMEALPYFRKAAEGFNTFAEGWAPSTPEKLSLLLWLLTVAPYCGSPYYGSPYCGSTYYGSTTLYSCARRSSISPNSPYLPLISHLSPPRLREEELKILRGQAKVDEAAI